MTRQNAVILNPDPDYNWSEEARMWIMANARRIVLGQVVQVTRQGQDRDAFIPDGAPEGTILYLNGTEARLL